MTFLPSLSQRHLVAIVVLSSFLAAACGSAVAQTSTDRAVATDQAAAPASQAATAVDQAVEIDAPPPSTGGHNYGASLTEFANANGSTQSSLTATASADATVIEWGDLIPTGSSPEEVFARFEERLEAVEIGSPESSALYEEMQAEFDPAANNPNLDGKKIWLAGFVAPLAYEDDIVTEFLLVPTFGACIHVPPPPANQTILVAVDKEHGLTLEESWGAVWVEGTITLSEAATQLGETSYQITNATSGAYNNF